jgi:hypothetical protein
MKIKNIICLSVAAFLFSCGNDYDLDENFDLTDLPGYVAFDAPGLSASLPDVEVTEDAGTASLTIENPTGTLSDITIEYSFGGDAAFGVDFNVSGASASGGTIVLEPKESDFQNPDRVDLLVELLTDGVADGNKTLTITLESASNDDGVIAVGRGGTDILRSANIIISDID